MAVLSIIARTTVLYLSVLLLMRIMGKREVGQLSLFDFVVAIMISELAAIPLSDTQMPYSWLSLLLHGILPITTLVLLEITLAYITGKSIKVRGIIEGTPSIVIERGRIIEPQLRRLRYNIDNMIMQMREQGVYNIEDVEYAILETNGKLSLVLKAAKRPVIPEDLGIAPAYEGLPLPLVTDGRLLEENLGRAGKDRQWLEDFLQREHNCRIADVLYASLDTKGILAVYKKGIKKTP